MDPKKIQELWKLTDFEMELILNPYGCEPEPVVFYCYDELREYSRTRLRDQDILDQTSPEYETFWDYLVWFTGHQDRFGETAFFTTLPGLIDGWFDQCNHTVCSTREEIEQLPDKIHDVIAELASRYGMTYEEFVAQD